MIGLFKRITGSLEFYHRISSNLLFSVPLPSSSGLTSISRNVGTMYNQGIEFRLGVDAVKRGDFNWNIDVNMSTVKNEITKLPQEEIIQGTKKLMVGHSIYDFWLQHIDPEQKGESSKFADVAHVSQGRYHKKATCKEHPLFA